VWSPQKRHSRSTPIHRSIDRIIKIVGNSLGHRHIGRHIVLEKIPKDRISPVDDETQVMLNSTWPFSFHRSPTRSGGVRERRHHAKGHASCHGREGSGGHGGQGGRGARGDDGPQGQGEESGPEPGWRQRRRGWVPGWASGPGLAAAPGRPS
jgi:hypothetical protein